MPKIIERTTGRVVCENPDFRRGAQQYRAGVPTLRGVDTVSFSIPAPTGPYIAAEYDLLLEEGTRRRLRNLLGPRESSPGVLQLEADVEDLASL